VDDRKREFCFISADLSYKAFLYSHSDFKKVGRERRRRRREIGTEAERSREKEKERRREKERVREEGRKRE
jgi:hypothetical protein